MRRSGVDRSVGNVAPRQFVGAAASRVIVSRTLYAVLLSATLSVACYSFSGSAGGLPRNLRTVAIQPFDNQTASPELQRELFDQLRKAMQDRLNLREAPEARADVVVRGVITRYDVDLPAGVSADPRQTTSTRRRLQLIIDVEIIDQTTGKLLLKRSGLSREGQYAEGGEATGRRNAIEGIVNDLIEGTQSQW